MASEDETEECKIPEKFGNTYDHTPLEKGADDQKKSTRTRRYLKDWFVTKECERTDLSTSFIREQRYPLPNNNTFSSDYILHGSILPSPSAIGNSGRSGTLPVPVCVSNLKIWVIDRSFSDRGIWIESEHAWYCLLKPCDKVYDHAKSSFVKSKVTANNTTSTSNNDNSNSNNVVLLNPNDDTPSLKSQEFLHNPLRAKFGLLSNLLDVLSEEKQVSYNYIPIHSKRTLRDIHALLSPSLEIWKRYNIGEQTLNREPFDLRLLETCPAFIRFNLQNYHHLLSNDSTFMKDLDEMELIRQTASSNEKSSTGNDLKANTSEHFGKRKVWNNYDYARSALEAEIRGMRHPWGELVIEKGENPGMKAKKIKPNRLIEIQVQQTIENKIALDEESAALKKRKKSDEFDDEVEAKKSRGDNVLSDNRIPPTCEEDEIGQNQVAGTGLKLMGDFFINDINVSSSRASKFSPRQMQAAIQHMSIYLEPKPTSEKDYDHDYLKYSISPDLINECLQEIVFNVNILSLETMLLVIESFRTSGPKVKKALFRGGKKSKTPVIVGGNIIFNKWLGYSIIMMEDRRLKFSKNKPVDGEQRTEEMVASSIIQLICDFDVIKDSKQVGILKTKYGVNWKDIIEKTLEFATFHHISELTKSCIEAKNHLNNMPGKPTIKDVNVTVSQDITIKRAEVMLSTTSPLHNTNDGLRDENIDHNLSNKTLTSSSHASSTLNNSCTDEVNPEKQRRALRMAQMVASARNRAGTAFFSSKTTLECKRIRDSNEVKPFPSDPLVIDVDTNQKENSNCVSITNSSHPSSSTESKGMSGTKSSSMNEWSNSISSRNRIHVASQDEKGNEKSSSVDKSLSWKNEKSKDSHLSTSGTNSNNYNLSSSWVSKRSDKDEVITGWGAKTQKNQSATDSGWNCVVKTGKKNSSNLAYSREVKSSTPKEDKISKGWGKTDNPSTLKEDKSSNRWSKENIPSTLKEDKRSNSWGKEVTPSTLKEYKKSNGWGSSIDLGCSSNPWNKVGLGDGWGRHKSSDSLSNQGSFCINSAKTDNIPPQSLNNNEGDTRRSSEEKEEDMKSSFVKRTNTTSTIRSWKTSGTSNNENGEPSADSKWSNGKLEIKHCKDWSNNSETKTKLYSDEFEMNNEDGKDGTRSLLIKDKINESTSDKYANKNSCNNNFNEERRNRSISGQDKYKIDRETERWKEARYSFQEGSHLSQKRKDESKPDFSASDRRTHHETTMKTSSHILPNIGSDDNNGSNGRGRGRGRTLPAWMKNSDIDAQKQKINSATECENNINTEHYIKMATSDGTSIIGRGRGKTLPAWLTKQQHIDLTSSRENRSRQVPVVSDHKDYSKSCSPSHYDDKSINGRGRGIAKTKPAWMTQNSFGNADQRIERTSNRSYDNSNSGNVHNTTYPTTSINRIPLNEGSNGESSSGYLNNSGRGRGRGKNINLPAWMTKK